MFRRVTNIGRFKGDELVGNGITTDPTVVREGAEMLRTRQEQWTGVLAAHRPHVPLAAFGVGLQGAGARLKELVDKAHDVRVAHAGRLVAAGRDAHRLADVVDTADATNAVPLGGGQR